ncbi:MAG: hypothetical protein A3F09_04490 [Chlamydiae bacterium RIFCSPHIGHO2_12_FULL_49_11]|nr:MAG: hypothetical protein A3F09_04490 [Chlamydiae bacterium RIFCSPHIGHO2_12_FULL_49_11]
MAAEEDHESVYAPGRRTIKILLPEREGPLFIDVKGGHYVIDPTTGQILENNFFGVQKVVDATLNGLEWKSQYKNRFQITISPKSPQTKIVVCGHEVKGSVTVYNLHQTLYVVLETDLEFYLEQKLTFLLKGEVLPAAVMEALAINERTNLYFWTENGSSPYFDLIDTEEEFSVWNNLITSSRAVRDASRASEKFVNLYNGRPFPAHFCKHSAGVTLSYARLFGKQSPAPAGICTPHAQKNRESTFWKTYLSSKDFETAFGVHKFQRIDIYQDAGSEKVYAVALKGEYEKKTVPIAVFQRKLGKERIKSSLFHVKKVADTFTLEGYGEGIGTGICLYEALRNLK